MAVRVLTFAAKRWSGGKSLLSLFGDMALYYCLTCDFYSVDANNYHKTRQKQYLMALQEALGLGQTDLGVSLGFYNTAEP